MSEQRYAVFIASSQYPNESKLQDLRCPENDVDALNELLSSKAHGDFTQIFVLKNKPSHQVLLKINQVLRKAGKNDLVLLYYSGHGKLNLAERLHLATVDTVLDALEATSIPVESIRNYVDISPSNKVILILDCCYSGAAGKSFSRGSMDEQLQQISGGRGTYILTASTGIQVAKEKEADQYGVLTKHILEGIKGGEADTNGDGFVDMDELYHYVHDRVLEEGCQEPMKWDLNVRGELIIARSGKTPREDRRKQIRELLFNLAGKGQLPDSILSKAMEVIALNKDQLSGTLKNYDILLDQLMRKKLEVGYFIEKWYKVGAEPSLKVSESPPEVKNIPCPKCGKANDDQAKFCYACGTNLQTIIAEPTIQQGVVSSTTLEEVSKFRLLVATNIDMLLSVFISVFFVGRIMSAVERGGVHKETALFATMFAIIILVISLFLIYWGGMVSSSKQATLGQRAMDIIVTDLNGDRLSFGEAIVKPIKILFTFSGFTKKQKDRYKKKIGVLFVTKR